MSTPKRSTAIISKVELIQFSLQDWDADESSPLALEDRGILDILDDSQVMKALTKRQRPVARLLAKGYTRQEVADRRGVCLQAVHQMVLVMRKRIKAHLEEQREYQ